jgi:hypothetical protein
VSGAYKMEITKDQKLMFINKVNLIVGGTDDKLKAIIESPNCKDSFTLIAQDMNEINDMAGLIRFDSFAEYAKIIKKVCSLCSITDNELAFRKAINMISAFLDTINLIFKSLIEPGISAMVDSKVKHAVQKLEIFERTFFPASADNSSVFIS